MTKQEIGGYRVVRQIGYGGMSTVYEAVDGEGRHVALKLLHPHIANVADGRERFRREVRMTQKVKGPYVAEVLDVETEEEDAFIVTQLIEGDTLENDVDERGRFTEGELVKLAQDLREAVLSIHAAGVLHRDLKPSNVMMKADKPVLIDFGIAQLGDDPRFTQAGFVTQTPGYCDPLVVQGAEPTMQADWWALAAVLAFAATSYPPFGSDGTLQVTNRVLTGNMHLPHLSPVIAAAFRRALSPDADERITFDELIAVIEDPNAAQSILGDVGAEPASTNLPAAAGGLEATGGLSAASGAAAATRAAQHNGSAEGGEQLSSLDQSAFASWQDTRESDGQTEVLGYAETPGTAGQRTEVLAHSGDHTEVFESLWAPDDGIGAEGAPGAAAGEAAPVVNTPTGTASQVPATEALPVQPRPAVVPDRSIPQPVPQQDPQVWDPRSVPGQQAYPAQQAYPVQQSYPGNVQSPYGAPAGQAPPGQESSGGEIPKWLRPPAPVRLPVALIGVMLLLLVASWPVIAVVTFAVLSVFAAIVGVAARDLNKRRMIKGGRFSGERLWIGVRLPWIMFKACLSQILGFALGLGFGGLVTWLIAMVEPTDPRVAPVVGAAVMFVMSWFMGGNNPAREGARRIAAGVAPSIGYRAFWVAVLVLLIGGMGFTQFMSDRAPNWTPLQEPTFFIHE